MKPMPVAAIDSATASGFRLMFTPSNSSTSALPDLLDTERPPCLAIFAPAAAATNIAAVDTLKVCAESPPVPQVSISSGTSGTGTAVANSRITVAAAAISPMVSFLTRNPEMIAAISTGDTSPLMICRINDSISSWKISRCSMMRVSASCGFITVSVIVFPRGNSSASGGHARSVSIPGETARPRPPASCDAHP